MKGGIPEEKIAEIKAKADLVEVVSEFVALRKSGKNFLGLCPFHAERTPSFTVNAEKGIFHCFGCGAGGSVFNFLMRTHDWTFPEAVRELAKRYRVVLPAGELTEEEKRRRSLQARLFEVNEIAAEYYHGVLLAQKEGEEGRKYFVQRGLAMETLREHRLGYAPAAWDSFALFCRKKGVPPNLAETLGLIIPRKEGTAPSGRPNHFDRFRRRVIFPIILEGGRIAGFGGRITDESPGSDGLPPPKYLNSPESAVYQKGRLFYGLNAARGAIRETGTAVIVEGYMDLLSLHQEGFRNVVASLGTALTAAQVALLARQAKEAVLVFDADESGRKATQRSLDLFLDEGFSAKVASLPPGFDPDSFVRSEKSAGFRRILDEALPVVDFLLLQALKRHGTQTVEGKVRAVRELLPVLNRLRDPLEQNLYVEQIAQRLGLKEGDLRASLRRREGPVPDAARPRQAEAPPAPAHERILLQLMVLQPRFVAEAEEILGPDALSDPRCRKVARELARLGAGRKDRDPAALLNLLEDEESKGLVSELILEEERIIDPERMFRDCLRKMELSRVQNEIRQVDEEIRRRNVSAKENPAGASGLKELLKRKQRLVMERKKCIGRSSLGIPRAEA